MHEKTAGGKTAGVLAVLVNLALICNLLALGFVPVLAALAGSGIGPERLVEMLTAAPPQPGEWGIHFSPGMVLFLVLVGGWTENFAYTLVLTLFLLFCGVCTAVILWQGRKILGTVRAGSPFCVENARSLRRAAVCCFLIAAASVARVVWGAVWYRSAAVLLGYNALFVPVCFISGLLCVVMSHLFLRAAQMREENEFTI